MSTNSIDQLNKVFKKALDLDPEIAFGELAYQQQPEWDSVSHMFLIHEIESEFNIELDSEDVLEMKSYNTVRRILEKYGIQFTMKT